MDPLSTHQVIDTQITQCLDSMKQSIRLGWQSAADKVVEIAVLLKQAPDLKGNRPLMGRLNDITERVKKVIIDDLEQKLHFLRENQDSENDREIAALVSKYILMSNDIELHDRWNNHFKQDSVINLFKKLINFKISTPAAIELVCQFLEKYKTNCGVNLRSASEIWTGILRKNRFEWLLEDEVSGGFELDLCYEKPESDVEMLMGPLPHPQQDINTQITLCLDSMEQSMRQAWQSAVVKVVEIATLLKPELKEKKPLTDRLIKINEQVKKVLIRVNKVIIDDLKQMLRSLRQSRDFKKAYEIAALVSKYVLMSGNRELKDCWNDVFDEDSGIHLFREVIGYGIPAPETIEILCNILKKYNIKRMVDLGSGTGIWTKILLEKGYECFPVDVENSGFDLDRLYAEPKSHIVPAYKEGDALLIVWGKGEAMRAIAEQYEGPVIIIGERGDFTTSTRLFEYNIDEEDEVEDEDEEEKVVKKRIVEKYDVAPGLSCYSSDELTVNIPIPMDN